MKLNTLMLALALAAAGAARADTIVTAKDIVSALTARPKAIQDSAGNWLQRDPSIDLQVQFDFNKSQLTPQGRQQLDELAAALQQPVLQTSAFEVAGHTDKTGTAAYNQKLSFERAEATRAYLMSKHGIVAERLVARGYGAERPADAARPDAAINRRVEIRRLPAVAAANGAAPVPATPANAPGEQLPQSGGAIIQRQ